MPFKNKIPLWLAIITNINIVIGSAFFVGAPKVARIAGPMAPLAWIIIGAMMIPLVSVLVQLSRKYPMAGGIYVYAQQTLGKFSGFLSGWGYFTGMAIGNAVVLHQITKCLNNIGLIPTLLSNASINILMFDLIFLALLVVTCMRGLKVLKIAQIAITTFTFIPLVLVLVLFPFIGKFGNLFAISTQPSWIITSTPFVLFAYIGIECCCAIAHAIKDGQRNTGRAIYISFAIVMGVYATIQYGMMTILGADAASLNPFSMVVSKIISNPTISLLGQQLISISIIVSFIGAVYGIFFSNNWNLYAMAKDGCIAGKKELFTKLNKSQMPFWSIMTQGFIMALFIIFMQNEDALMNMNDLGVFVTYLVCTIAFAIAKDVKTGCTWLIGIAALASTSVLLGMCIKHLIEEGFISALPFIVIMSIGIVGFFLARKKQQTRSNI